MLTVHFHKSGRTVRCRKGQALMDLCPDGQNEVRFDCRAGACGSCLIDVAQTPSGLTPISARERCTLERIGANLHRHRLACMNQVIGDLDIVEVTPTPSREVPAAMANTVPFKAEVAATRLLAPLVREVTLSLLRPETITFLPGQYLSFDIPDHRHTRRSYSIASSPTNDRYVTTCIRSVSGGMGSNFMHRLALGDAVRFRGPFGRFTLAPIRKHLLFIATGTGIAPIMSMLRFLAQGQPLARIRLYFGLRHIEDIFYQDELNQLAHTLPDFRYTICLSKPYEPWWEGYVGRVTTRLDQEVTPEMAADHEAYLCGGRSMVEDTRTILTNKGFAPNQIHHETFY